MDNEGYFVLINQISGEALTASENDTLKTEKSMIYNMAFPVVEFSRQGYKIRKVFG